MRSLLSRRALLGAALALGLTWAMVSGRGSADPNGRQPEPVVDEPITGDPVLPERGQETGPLRPFDPPPVGKSDVPLAALSPEEAAYVVVNRPAHGWSEIHNGFGGATKQAAFRAAAEAAANELGIPGLGELGVVP